MAVLVAYGWLIFCRGRRGRGRHVEAEVSTPAVCPSLIVPGGCRCIATPSPRRCKTVSLSLSMLVLQNRQQ